MLSGSGEGLLGGSPSSVPAACTHVSQAAERQRIVLPICGDTLDKEIKRRTRVVGIFPDDPSIERLVGAMMMEQNDEWAVARRYMTLGTIESVCDDKLVDAVKLAALT